MQNSGLVCQSTRCIGGRADVNLPPDCGLRKIFGCSFRRACGPRCGHPVRPETDSPGSWGTRSVFVRDPPIGAGGAVSLGRHSSPRIKLAIADLGVSGSRWQMDILSEGRHRHWGAVSLDLRYCPESARVDVTDAGKR
jgi:hypothetical protein